MQYKILGISENKYDPEGYFYNSEFLPTQNAISFNEINVNGKKIKGIIISENISEELKILLEKLKTERESNITQIVNELVEGKRNIHFNIVGCDYPHYQAWVNNLSKDLDGLEQDIMTRAIKMIMGDDFYFGNPCDFLQKLINKSVGSIESLGNVLNPEYGTKTQEYHSFKNTVVTGFELKLYDILKPKLEKNEAYKQKISAIFTKAKETGEKQLLRQYMDDCDGKDLECSFDSVYEYAIPDGTIKVERVHCY
jgi:hypothetical protein